MEPQHGFIECLKTGTGKVRVASLTSNDWSDFEYKARKFDKLKVGSHMILVRAIDSQGRDRLKTERVAPLLTGELPYKGIIHMVVGDDAAFIDCPYLGDEVLLRPRAINDPSYTDGKRFLVAKEEMKGKEVYFSLKPDTRIALKCAFSEPIDSYREPSSHDGSSVGIMIPPIGCWNVMGCCPSELFNYPFEIKCRYREESGVEGIPLINAIPPLLDQESGLILDLEGVGKQHTVELKAVLDEDGSDYTQEVCRIEATTHVEEAAGVTPIHRLVVNILPFNIVSSDGSEDDRSELQFQIIITDRAQRSMELTSKPFYVRMVRLSSQPPAVRDSVSFKYWSYDVLRPEDMVVCGFQDPGRSNEFQHGEGSYQDAVKRVREVITIDKSDMALYTLLEEAKEVGHRILEIRPRATALGWLVSCRMGGPNVDERSYEMHMKQLRGIGKKRPRFDEQGNFILHKVSNTVQLGSMTFGLCRHRAVLFKFLAERMNIPTYLVRGFYVDEIDGKKERHTWNVIINEDGEPVYVDTMLQSIIVPPAKVASYISAPIPPFKPDEPHTQYHIPRPDTMQLHEELGRGATAAVRRITIGDMTCALKVPKGPNERKLLAAEFYILKALRKTGGSSIVQTLGWRNGLLLQYFPFSLLGFTNQLATRRKLIGTEQIRKVLLGVASALEECHGRGFVHRDVKSENVLLVVSRCDTCAGYGLVCPECGVKSKLADFADAFQLPVDEDGEYTDAPSTAWGKFGTRPYACPEFNAVVAFSQSADMWSLGILAVELANMELPKNKATAPGVMVTNTYVDPPVPLFVPTHNLGSEAPSWLSQIIEGCLQVDRHKRLSASDVVSLLATVN